MAPKTFEELDIWKRAQELCVQIYKHFSDVRDFRFRDQIQGASVSIMNNVAEGFERKGNRELSRFLYIAKGSAGEVRSMMYLAEQLHYVEERQCRSLRQEAAEIGKMIGGWLRSLHQKE